MSQPVLIPLVVLAGILALAVLAVVVLTVANPEAARRRVLSLFRRPARAPRTPGQKHYYKPYWS